MTIHITPFTADDVSSMEGVQTPEGKYTRNYNEPAEMGGRWWWTETGEARFVKDATMARMATEYAILRTAATAAEQAA